MKFILYTLAASLLALISIGAASTPTALINQWNRFPFDKLPTLVQDDGISYLIDYVVRNGRTKILSDPTTLIDIKNQYLNLSLAEDGFLEFVVWSGKNNTGAIVANRYRGDEQKFNLWMYSANGKLVAAKRLLNLSATDVSRGYRAITGRAWSGVPAVHWDFPRQGTTIIASLVPTDSTLLAKCKTVARVEYDCGSALDLAHFTWTGTTFKRTWLRQ